MQQRRFALFTDLCYNSLTIYIAKIKKGHSRIIAHHLNAPTYSTSAAFALPQDGHTSERLFTVQSGTKETDWSIFEDLAQSRENEMATLSYGIKKKKDVVRGTYDKHDVVD